jgi:GT2 family glycosyltransferase
MFYQKLFHLFHRGIFHDRRVGVHGNPAAWVQKLIPSTYLSGGVSAYRRAVFDKVKLDTRNDFFMLEDIDFSTRAVCEFGAGRFFINTSARLTHLMSPVNRARLAGRYERKLREFVVFYKKNRGQASSLANLLWLLVGLSFEAIVAAARARHIGPLSGSIKGLLDGIKWRVRA